MRAVVLLTLALLLAACGSKTSSPPASSTAATTTTSSSSSASSGTNTMSTTVTVRKPAPAPKLVTVYATSGKGPGVTKAISAPTNWQLAWGWTCHGSKGSFAVTAHGGSAGAAKKLLSQTGIGGGGQRAFPVSGTFSLAVQAKAACPWTLKIVK